MYFLDMSMNCLGAKRVANAASCNGNLAEVSSTKFSPNERRPDSFMIVASTCSEVERLTDSAQHSDNMMSVVKIR